MTIEEKIKVLSACRLFRGLSESGLRAAAEAAEQVEIPAGQQLFSADERRLGVIAMGSARAVKPKKEGAVTMSILGYGDVFGAVTVMADELPNTEAFAIKQVKALVFSAESFKRLMRNDFALTENFCRYLTSRIRFLTERVECMAGSTAADKLLSYFESTAQNGVAHISFGMEALAKALSVSRASLYRALTELETSGRISRKGHDIRLL
ncbi:MAG: Crp/Fnr family transcriptional regulator [Clostridiales bacterium]|nr:Crp/Fnr family transcriptional regulator [Clostridiales bacterium]